MYFRLVLSSFHLLKNFKPTTFAITYKRNYTYSHLHLWCIAPHTSCTSIGWETKLKVWKVRHYSQKCTKDQTRPGALDEGGRGKVRLFVLQICHLSKLLLNQFRCEIQIRLRLLRRATCTLDSILNEYLSPFCSHSSRFKSGQNHLTDFIGVEPSKKRKRRTSFTPQALELLNGHFERNTHPSGKQAGTSAWSWSNWNFNFIHFFFKERKSPDWPTSLVTSVRWFGSGSATNAKRSKTRYEWCRKISKWKVLKQLPWKPINVLFFFLFVFCCKHVPFDWFHWT